MADPQLEKAYEQLAPLDEDALLSIVGSAALTPEERAAAALRAFAPEEAEQVDAERLFGAATAVNLAVRGRRLIERLLDECGDRLRDTICPSYTKMAAAERNLVLDVASVVAPALGTVLGVAPPAALVVAVAVVILRYWAARLCRDFVAP